MAVTEDWEIHDRWQTGDRQETQPQEAKAKNQ